jgi:hypothetical protein
MTKYLLLAAVVAIGVAALMAASPAFQPHSATDEAQAVAITLSAQAASDVAHRDAETRSFLFSYLGQFGGLGLLAAGIGLPAVIGLRFYLLYRHDQELLGSVHHLVLTQPSVTVTLQTGRHSIMIERHDVAELPPPGEETDV